MCLLCAAEQANGKLSDLNKTIADLKKQLAEKNAALQAAKAESELAVARKELEMQKTLYDSIEKARTEGRNNAIQALKDMKALASTL